MRRSSSAKTDQPPNECNPAVGGLRLARMSGGLLLVGLSLLLLCAARKPAEPKADPPRQLQLKARQLVAKATKLRGLRQRRPIPMGVMNRQQILERIKQRLAQDYTDEEIKNDSAILQRLGLLPVGTNYKTALLKLLTDQIAGFYDPHVRRLNIADWLPLAMQTPALIHEICHALQDQAFNLKRFVKPLKTNSDRHLARLALVEGDCTAVMIEYFLAASGRNLSQLSSVVKEVAKRIIGSHSSPAFKAAPPFLRKTLTFPYIQGLAFVQHARNKRGWTAVNRCFYRPPQSTEQILHHDKWRKGEAPIRISPGPIPSLADYRLIKTDTLGEFQLLLLLAESLPKAKAEDAASGWGGDRMAAYRHPDRPKALPLIVHLSAWDSLADAKAFYAALTQLLRERHLSGPRPGNSKASGGAASTQIATFRDSMGDAWRLEYRDERVLLLIGVAETAMQRVADEVWASWRSSR